MDESKFSRSSAKLKIIHNTDFLTAKDICTALEYNNEIKDFYIKVKGGDGVDHLLRALSIQKAADGSYIELETSLLV